MSPESISGVIDETSAIPSESLPEVDANILVDMLVFILEKFSDFLELFGFSIFSQW